MSQISFSKKMLTMKGGVIVRLENKKSLGEDWDDIDIDEEDERHMEELEEQSAEERLQVKKMLVSSWNYSSDISHISSFNFF